MAVNAFSLNFFVTFKNNQKLEQKCMYKVFTIAKYRKTNEIPEIFLT